jgi:hypothetical protein
MLSRRRFLTLTTTPFVARAIAGLQASAATMNGNVVAGAIRWDAWYRPHDNSIYAQKSLSSANYHARAPAHCRVSLEATMSCVGSQVVMDAEIEAARRGGLKYWAFTWYAAESSLRFAWNLYQSSAYKDAINWCGIVGLDSLGSLPFSRGPWRSNIHEWARHMQQSNYQKIHDGMTANRPLLYILWNSDHLRWYFDNSLANVRAALTYLRALVTESALGAPYVVLLGGPRMVTIALETDADAISSYISKFETKPKGTYADLDRITQAYWEVLEDTGLPIVPIAMVGWDTRPRQERPGPWEAAGKPNPNPTRYFALATPAELASHVSAAVKFTRTRPAACPAKALLIYSWNECDEGGGLIPTLGDPKGSYLSAIAPILS